MQSPPTARIHWLPWLVIGPLLVLAGAALGHAYPGLTGRDAVPSWTPPQNVAKETVPATAPSPLPSPLPSLAPLVAKIRGGVVGITTLRRPEADGSGNEPTQAPGAAAAPQRERYSVPTEEILGFGTRGTGFLVHADGLVVTSQHVVAGYERIQVQLPGQRECSAEVVGEDPISDLALLRLVDPPADLQALPLGDSSLVRQGDFVVSLGNPFEFHDSLSFGMITFVGRHVAEKGVLVTNEYLQFSAPVNPGDSGAPLVDMRGHVIGVTRRTLDEGRGISFGTPSKSIKALLRAVERGDQQVKRGYLGVEFRAPRHPEELRGLVAEGGGAEVTRVIKGHPADQAGIQAGDVILSFAGQAVEDAALLYDQITVAQPGSQAPISVYRSGQVLAPMSVTIGEVGKLDSRE